MNRVLRQILCTLLRFYSAMDTTALGTIEYGVAALGVPLIVVMATAEN
jgi:carbonic anhydrase